MNWVSKIQKFAIAHFPLFTRYGDKTPKSKIGRCIGLLWLFMSAALMSGFTAMLTSSLNPTSEIAAKKVICYDVDSNFSIFSSSCCQHKLYGILVAALSQQRHKLCYTNSESYFLIDMTLEFKPLAIEVLSFA